MADPLVCRFDGALVAESRSGRLVHVDELPQDTPAHEIETCTLRDYQDRRAGLEDLLAAGEDMLVHHATLHPGSDCEWAIRLDRALRARM